MPKPNIGQGDTGEAFLFGSGKRFPKDNAQFEALGTLDELNSALGYAASLAQEKATVQLLEKIQTHLFEAQSIAGTEQGYERDKRVPLFSRSRVSFLERTVERLEQQSAPLQNFILPGGTPLGAWLHVCRTLARRAERRLVSLSREKDFNPAVRAYVNRLSDVLFALARAENARQGRAETSWKGLRKG